MLEFYIHSLAGIALSSWPHSDITSLGHSVRLALSKWRLEPHVAVHCVNQYYEVFNLCCNYFLIQ